MRTPFSPDRWLAALAALIPLTASAAGEPGLVAHYTFDQDEADTAVDQSGNNHHGRIYGAKHVPSPRGQALSFDGVDDYVDCGRDPALNLAGDVTLEAWIRAETVSDRNRLIYGDAAGLTINRNFNLRIDRGVLRFEHGDGSSGTALLADGLPLTDGWKHIAVVCEAPRYILYVDGRPAMVRVLDQPITPTRGANRRIGGWHPGWFEGDIDEIRVYNRALPEREIVAHAGLAEGQAPQPQFSLQPALFYQAGYLALEGYCTRLPAGDLRATATLTSGAGAVAVEETGPMAETRPGSERGLAKLRLPTADLTPGPYRLDLKITSPAGQTVAELTDKLDYPARPRWYDSPEGRADIVPPPFTPVRVERQKEQVSLMSWGRAYRFGEEPFVDQIRSRGADLLAAPIRLVAKLDGQPVRWAGPPVRLGRTTPTRAEVSREIAAGGLVLRVDATVEYDGFLSIDWSLAARQTTVIDELAIEIPLHRRHARYFYNWPVTRSGALGADYATSFRPLLWLGDEERGLSWLAESDQHWYLDEAGRAVQARVGDDQVVLRLNLIDHATPVQPGEKLEYWFALQATPLKPVVRDVWEERIVRNPWYGYSLDIEQKEVEGRPALEHFEALGARAMLVLRWWDAFSYTSPLGHEDEFRRLVAACHEHGIKVVPYTGGFLLSERAPEYQGFHTEMVKRPLHPYPIDRLPGLDKQMTYIVCHNSSWQDFLVGGVARLIDEYDVDGVYFDSTILPWACRNEAHGCGYVDRQGRRRATYPIRAIRETMRRIYLAVKQRKPDGIIDVHPYDAMNSAALAYATSYWNGEQLPRGLAKDPARLPLERFRTEFMGHNWGVPADLLYYVIGNQRAAAAWALVHDVPVRPENLDDLAVMAALWRLRER